MAAYLACSPSSLLYTQWTSSCSEFFPSRRGRSASLANARASCLHGRAVALPSKLWRRAFEGKERLGSSLTVNASTTSVQVLDADLEARISLAVSTGRLDLSECGLQEVPPRVFEISDLVDLSLAGNRITSLPEDIKNLRALRRLGLAGNLLQELPEGIGNLQQLEGLWLHGNVLQSLPPQIGDLRQLRMLALAGNKLAQLPESISGLTNLQVLSVAGNKLCELPSGIGNLKALTVLAAYGNALRCLPESLTKLASLRDLWLQGNELEVLPESWGAMCSLKQFSLADNRLEVLPESIAELQSLETLWIYCNKLKNIPRSLATMKKLQYVWAEGNPLESEPLWESLTSFSSLKALGISSNVVLPSAVPESMAKVLYRSEISGSGEALERGGYFKLQQWDLEKKADTVIVAFGSAPAVPNWAGLLQKVKAEMKKKQLTSTFDILFVVDSKRSWYTHEDTVERINDVGLSQQTESSSSSSSAYVSGLGSYYREELEFALRPYKQVIMLGDSMGASAALMFSPLATSVVAFCPQVDLSTSSIRPGHSQSWLQTFKEDLLRAVSLSSARISVHSGTWSHDVNQAKLLPSDKVTLKVHDVDNHRLALELNTRNLLPAIVLHEVQECSAVGQ
ncbi:hypothetical protein KC19_12G170000 [Ceratodon purpureus]|uniref:Disease resistance R13L4/SHOC-2-like LRR domain-containing protein n=1 Tax=Ceratodon purpureus TaxID=3225 RepID=A0A8T0G8R0_CERPU|nr:hypothetical protein KC19_12G170000 [Ceratodon purpureus]